VARSRRPSGTGKTRECVDVCVSVCARACVRCACVDVYVRMCVFVCGVSRLMSVIASCENKKRWMWLLADRVLRVLSLLLSHLSQVPLLPSQPGASRLPPVFGTARLWTASRRIWRQHPEQQPEPQQ
jgi:hypothetical protein